MKIAKYRKQGVRGEWFLTDFTMGQVEELIIRQEKEIDRQKKLNMSSECDRLRIQLTAAAERERVLMEALLLEREECAKIAEKYEPDEKLDYVTYASKEIRLRGDKLKAAIDRERVLTKAIENIAIQKLEAEMDEEYREGADYQTGYECIVKVARAALAQARG